MGDTFQLLQEIFARSLAELWNLLGTTPLGFCFVPIVAAGITWSRSQERWSCKTVSDVFVNSLAAALIVFVLVFMYEALLGVPHQIRSEAESSHPSDPPPPRYIPTVQSSSSKPAGRVLSLTGSFSLSHPVDGKPLRLSVQIKNNTGEVVKAEFVKRSAVLEINGNPNDSRYPGLLDEKWDLMLTQKPGTIEIPSSLPVYLYIETSDLSQGSSARLLSGESEAYFMARFRKAGNGKILLDLCYHTDREGRIMLCGKHNWP